MGLSKTRYAYHLSTLMSVACFAGLFSLTILLLLPRPACTPTLARISTLLTLTTPLFLSAILLSLLLNILLHPLADSDTVLGVRRIIMRLGLSLLYLYLGTGLIIFALAAQVVQVREPSIGWLGVAVVGIVCVGIMGMGAKGERERSKKGDVMATTKIVLGDLKRPRALLMLGVFVVQAGILVAMLGIGGRAVVKGGVDVNCPDVKEELGDWSKDRPLPVNVISGRFDAVDVVVTVTEICCNGKTFYDVLDSSQTASSSQSGIVEPVIVWTTTTTRMTVTAR